MMYFRKSFTLKRDNYDTFQGFFAAVKYYLNRYKHNEDVDIVFEKDSRAVKFVGKNNTRFY